VLTPQVSIRVASLMSIVGVVVEYIHLFILTVVGPLGFPQLNFCQPSVWTHMFFKKRILLHKVLSRLIWLFVAAVASPLFLTIHLGFCYPKLDSRQGCAHDPRNTLASRRFRTTVFLFPWCSKPICANRPISSCKSWFLMKASPTSSWGLAVTFFWTLEQNLTCCSLQPSTRCRYLQTDFQILRFGNFEVCQHE